MDRLHSNLCCIHLGVGTGQTLKFNRFNPFVYRFYFFCFRYCSMTYIVDQLFPPIKYDEVAVEFSNFNYWRDPIPELPELETALVPPSTKVDISTLRPIPEKWINKWKPNATQTQTYEYSISIIYTYFIHTYLILLWSFLFCCTSSRDLFDYLSVIFKEWKLSR